MYNKLEKVDMSEWNESHRYLQCVRTKRKEIFHLVAKGTGAVIGACDITNTRAVVLAWVGQTGGALRHHIQINRTCWEREEK